ncbi:g6918 [Coccomyxa elongata]
MQGLSCCRERSVDNNGGRTGNRKLLQNIVGQIECDALGNCDDGRGHRYYDQNHDDRRRGDRGNNGDWRRDNGRKLQQNIVGQIICDTFGNCNDGRGGRWYDEGRDDR